jgi:AAA+ ATPase superfamily predicted ATPase
VRLGIVSGRRRQGKTYLLDAAATTFGGFFFAATDSTETESLASFGRALAGYGGGRYAFADWDEALQRLFGVVSDGLIIIDEFPYLMKGSPALPSLIQRALGPRGSAQQSRARMVLAGSAMSVMGRLLGGNAPLRGRASMEMIIRPFGYRDAARFWGISDPGLALLVHSVVGGTPAYRREFVTGDAPPRSPISIRGCCGPCSTRSFRSSAKPVTCWRRKPTSATRPATMPFSAR